MTKKILVTSHERSGTSFLINTIGMNFPHYLPEASPEGENQRVDLDNAGINFADPDEMLGFLRNPQFHDLPISNIFKAHQTSHYFEPVWDYLQSQFRIFNVYRDGRDVLCSYHRHVRKQGYYWAEQTFTVGEFLRAKPIGAACRYHGPRPPVNMVQRWNDHVLSWLKPKRADVCYISYEQMSNNFDGVVKQIAAHLQMDVPAKIIRPGIGGVHPGKGVVGNWKDLFVEGDEDFLFEYAGKAMNLIGMELTDAVSHIPA